ncbi:MAG: helix-turn-helix domain-containing protein [Janthinobacterium lividum]
MRPHAVIRTVADIGHLRRERLRQGLTQVSLAERIGTTQRWISEIENGKASAEIGRVLHWIQALGLEVAIGGPDTAARPSSPGMTGRPSLKAVLDRLTSRSVDG